VCGKRCRPPGSLAKGQDEICTSGRAWPKLRSGRGPTCLDRRAIFIITVVAYYNNENLSATFGGLAGHPFLLVVTAYIIGPPLIIYLVGPILVGLDAANEQT
jgi:hypothetical protein